ncbi:hypothetical protein BGZ96_009642 [Linnemannia gamsii]|uniref:Uncharacterized protein n=1 Tax=Linnemannia gamsii TaxID=64522 RepID=A0ABQ7JWQ6_9FUNG|nr:hypothetical protein BGZ96_009642 [Linnemannia gamsii]
MICANNTIDFDEIDFDEIDFDESDLEDDKDYSRISKIPPEIIAKYDHLIRSVVNNAKEEDCQARRMGK